MPLLNPVEELNHYYSGCVLCTKEGDKNIPYYVDAFTLNAKGEIYCSGSMCKDDKKELYWHPHAIDASEIEYTFPELGVINVNKGVVFIDRLPERQYKKGLYERILYKQSPMQIVNKIYAEHRIDILKLSILHIAYNLFNPIYYSPSKIIHAIKNNTMYGGAFNREFAIHSTFNENEIHVSYKDCIIGWVKDKKIVLPPKNAHFEQALSEYMPTEVQ